MVISRFAVLPLCVTIVYCFLGVNARFQCKKDETTRSYNCENDSPNDGKCDFETEYSPLCRSALHDLRISSWDTAKRKVTFIRKMEDPEQYHDTIRQGVESARYGKLLGGYKDGIFYFTSPRIKEPLEDMTSLHRNFLFAKNEYSVQECHLAGQGDNRSVHFSYRNILKEGTPIPIGEKKRGTNHDYYQVIWGRVLRDKVNKEEVRKSIPGGVECRLDQNDLSVVTSMTMMNNAHFRPARLTVTGNVGEPLTLSMKVGLSCNSNPNDVTWRKDAKEMTLFRDFKTEHAGFSYNLRYDSLVEGHAGVYSLECDQYQKKTTGERFDRRGVVRLIVRSCPANLFGDHCNVSCPECQNGGICHDLLGVCVCPPGFKGSNCETPCGPNRFGADCSKRCSDTETCSGILFCLPDPYGCSCATGFEGLDCKSACPAGKYGAGCSQERECHCAEGQPCDAFTGLCHQGCEDGWKDTACVTPYPVLSSRPKLVTARPTRLEISFQAWDGTSGKGTPATYVVELKERTAVGSFQEVFQYDANALKYPEYKNADIQGLKPNTEYDVRVVIVDVDGQAQRDHAPNDIFRTACGKPKASPSDLQATSPDPSTVVLKWQNPKRETFQCSNVTIVISYSSRQDRYEETLTTMKETFKFRSKPFATWIIAIRIQTENNKSSDWETFPSITTAEDAPEVPRSLNTFYNSATKSIFVNWTEPKEANGILRAYNVKLVHANWQHYCLKPVPNIVFNVSSQVTSAVFNATDFKQSSSYQVLVAAITIKKGRDLMKAITTPESVPEASPKDLSLTNIESRFCVIRWSPPECAFSNGIIVNYSLSVQGQEQWASDVTTLSSTIISAQLNSLIPYTKYEVTIAACTSAGCGRPSDKITFATLPARPGSPSDLTIFSTTTSSLSISWSAPFPPLSNVTSYKILYQKRNTYKTNPTKHETKEANELPCKNSEVRLNNLCYTITNLEAKTEYDIWVIAVDDKYKHSQQDVFVSGITEESKPEAPSDLKLENRTTNSLFVSWLEPMKANGVLVEYKITVTLINLYGLNPIDGKIDYSIKVRGEIKRLNLTELQPASTYNVTVEAATNAGYGPPIFELFYTRNLIPEVNVRPEVGKITKNSVLLLIKPIDNYKGPISAYFVLVKDVTKKRYKRAALEFHTFNQSRTQYIAAKLLASQVPPEGVNFTVGDGEYYEDYYNAPLENGHEYIFGTAVLSEVDGERQIGYAYLDEIVFVTDESSAVTPQAGIIIGTVLAVILIFGIFSLILIYKKPELFYAIKGTGTNTFLMKYPKTGLVKERAGSTNSVADMDLYDDCLVRNSIKTNQIHIKDLEAYVQEANTSSNISQEYISTGKGIIHPCKVGKQAENKSKNRYPTLVPYDHSRVKLEKIEGDPYSDYINANYIENYKGEPKFIATQGPKPLTVNDFWRMVWRENTCKIIMVTNLVEVGKTKCEKYWPESMEKYGPFTVKLIETVTFADFVVRTMIISKDECQREIKQFHFTSWPDHGIPAYPVAVTTFLKQIRNYNEDSQSPIVVHCSAGIGRTGTIILLANMIEMAKNTDTVDLQHGLWSMRQCRVNLVETLEQYIFVYHALVDHLFSGETSLLCPEFRKKYDDIVEAKNGYPSVAQNEFERLKRLCPLPKFPDCRAGHEPENVRKNRTADILPTDRARSILPIKEAGQNDYVNAVYINGYKRNNAFIATQLPLPDTINDFWRLVHSNKIRSIVLLHEFNRDDSTCPQYWTNGAIQTYGDVEVNHVSSETQGTVLVRTFQIRDVRLNDEEMTVKQFHLQCWHSTKDTPETPDCILELIEKTERWQKNTGARTLLVQCLNGSSGCGVFCASVFIRDKIKTEHEVDVYLAVRSVRTNRPQFVTNLNQYVFLHKVAIMYLDSFETYANFQ